MKTIIITCIFSFYFGAFQCQTVMSSCNAPDSVKNLYRDDVDRLCLKRTYNFNSTWKDSVFIDTTFKQQYLKALLAVYNATMLPARDTVIRRCNIHVFTNPDTKGIFIAGDSNLVWLKNIRYNVSPCGNPTIDNAILKYGLQKVSFQAPNYWIYHTATYKKINGNLNMIKLGLIFDALPYVSSGPNASAIDGTEIFDTLAPNYTQLTYSYGWNDCWNGCIYRRFWTFKIYNDCSVEYVGSYGNPVPPTVGIAENSARFFADIKVYPNPTAGKFYIQIGNALGLAGEVTNVLGQKILNVGNIRNEHELDLSTLTAGIYYLTLQNELGQKSFKIIKE